MTLACVGKSKLGQQHRHRSAGAPAHGEQADGGTDKEISHLEFGQYSFDTRDALLRRTQTAFDGFDDLFLKFFCWRFGLAAVGD